MQEGKEGGLGLSGIIGNGCFQGALPSLKPHPVSSWTITTRRQNPYYMTDPMAPEFCKGYKLGALFLPIPMLWLMWASPGTQGLS